MIQMPTKKYHGSSYDPGGSRQAHLNRLAYWLVEEGCIYIQKNVDGVNNRNDALSIISMMYLNLATHPRLLLQVLNAKNPLAYLMISLKRFACKQVNKNRKESMLTLLGEQGETELRKQACTTDLYKELIRKEPNFLKKLRRVLAPREYDVFIIRADGNTEKQVARRLRLKLSTVKGYSKSMRAKLKALGIDFFDINE